MYPDLKNNLMEFKKHLIETTNSMEPLKVWEMQGMCCILFLINTILFTISFVILMYWYYDKSFF